MLFNDFDKNHFSDELYRKLTSLIYDRTGLFFGENSRFFLEKRVELRITALNLRNLDEYVRYLMFDSDSEKEWDSLITTITTNETYFMREERQLKCFKEDILPEIAKKRAGSKIRIWSAGCSSGEEPYTIAILVKESKCVPEHYVEILATDINSRVINKAKEGIYGESSFRSVNEAFKARWFISEGNQKWRIKDEVKARVTFQRFNLFELDRYALLGNFDVIFCRNVIIYFDMDAKVKVVERFFDKLHDGGYLLLGHSESLISVTEKFKLIHLPSDLVYRKE
ncbi:MAG: protein-glutamate O-methyltransferase CheR [Acidobacteriota bacterium]|nr:protein-glutamate O-methyltransferase CheR [Thermoanaerobaculaceae bacterium]